MTYPDWRARRRADLLGLVTRMLNEIGPRRALAVAFALGALAMLLLVSVL